MWCIGDDSITVCCLYLSLKSPFRLEKWNYYVRNIFRYQRTHHHFSAKHQVPPQPVIIPTYLSIATLSRTHCMLHVVHFIIKCFIVLVVIIVLSLRLHGSNSYFAVSPYRSTSWMYYWLRFYILLYVYHH